MARDLLPWDTASARGIVRSECGEVIKTLYLTNRIKVLSDSVRRVELGEEEAIGIVKQALYTNAAKLYHIDD